MRRSLAVVALVAVVAGGCAPLRRRVPLAPARVPEAVLVDALASRRAAVTSLRARARLKAGLSSLWTREAVLVRRPDCLRIDVLSPFGLAVAVGAQGDRLWAYPVAERTRYEGPATPENVTRFLGAPVTVAEVVDLLLGVPPAVSRAGTPIADVDEGLHRLTIPTAAGAQVVWFAPGTLDVVRAEERHGEDAVALRVRFADHRDGFPRRLDVSSPPTGAEARLVYDAVEPNAVVDPALCAPPAAARVLPLAAEPG